MRRFLSNMFYYNEQVDVSYHLSTRRNYILQYLYFVTLYLKSTGHHILYNYKIIICEKNL